MNYFPVLPILLICIFGSCTNQPHSDNSEEIISKRWVDLTYPFDSETIYWPTSESFILDTVAKGFTEGGYYYSAYKFSMSEHGGTHLDAPIHFAEGQKSVDELSIEDLAGDAIVLDVSTKSIANPDYQISIEDFKNWEEKNGTLPENSILLLHTGFGQYWPDPTKYLGTDEKGPEAIAKLHFPGLDPAAARWLVENRKIKAVGLDTPSIDYGQSKNFDCHQILFSKNIPVFENVANLHLLPTKGAWIIALPIKIKGGSGGPLRIVASIPD